METRFSSHTTLGDFFSAAGESATYTFSRLNVYTRRPAGSCTSGAQMGSHRSLVDARFYLLRSIASGIFHKRCSELTHVFFGQDGSSVRALPRFPCSVSRLAESSPDMKRTRLVVKVLLAALFLQDVLLVVWTGSDQPNVEKSIAFVLTVPVLYQERDIFQHVDTIFPVVLACFSDLRRGIRCLSRLL